MRADRLLSMIWLLRIHGGLSSAELASRLEVSRRTVLRDVEALSAAGVPVYCERGPRGGVRLLPGYRTEVTALSDDESRAIFAALSPWGAEALGLRDALVSGARKLLAAIPDARRPSSLDVASRLVVDPHGWLPKPEATRPGAAFATIQAAVFSRRRLRLTYQSRRVGKRRDLVVEPHGLVSAGSDWYLCAGVAGEVRFLKAARVVAAELLESPCSEDVVDVAATWREHRDRFLKRFDPVTVTGWLAGERRADAEEWAIRVEPSTSSTQPPGKGWEAVRLEFMDRLHAVTVLLRLGPDVRVDEPEEVRAELVDHLKRTLELCRMGDQTT